MINKEKNSVFDLSLTFLVALIGMIIISPFELLLVQVPWWAFFPVAASITLLSFILGWILRNSSLSKLIAVDFISFFLTGAGLLAFGNEFDHLILYLIAFLIMPLPLVALRVLMYVLSHVRTDNLKQIVQDQTDEGSSNLFELANESGKLVLSLPGNKIICFEANDNYVITYFLDHDNELKKSMDRTSLKHIENLVQKSNLSFLRVHKSFLINPIYVEGVLGKSQAYKLKLHFIQEPVSVSRSFDISIIKPQPVISIT